MVTTATMADVERATAIAERHPGWTVRASRPMATRAAGNHRRADPQDGTYAETVITDTWRQLDDELAEQDQNDERWAK